MAKQLFFNIDARNRMKPVKLFWQGGSRRQLRRCREFDQGFKTLAGDWIEPECRYWNCCLSGRLLSQDWFQVCLRLIDLENVICSSL